MPNAADMTHHQRQRENVMTRPTLLFISQFAHPGTYDKAKWRRLLGEDDETIPFEAMLDSLGVLSSINYRGIRAHQSEPLPDDLGTVDAVILGGSYANISDHYDWQEAITQFLRAWRPTGKPLLGICGGHQMMTTVLDGTVERSPHGAEVGSLPIQLTAAGASHPLFEGFESGSSFYFGNSEVVTNPPSGSVSLATRPNDPNTALDYGGNWLSVQFHPEATCDRMATLWSELNPANSALYRFIPDCERIILNFVRFADLLGDDPRQKESRA
jgi:GMP synthase-like glutamine amidotransferase